jgi:hypothetical protein
VSARHVYVIVCDAPGCERRFSLELARADETRAHASLEGWIHRIIRPDPPRGGPAQSLDYCREHADLGEGLDAPTLPRFARRVAS